LISDDLVMRRHCWSIASNDLSCHAVMVCNRWEHKIKDVPQPHITTDLGLGRVDAVEQWFRGDHRAGWWAHALVLQ